MIRIRGLKITSFWCIYNCCGSSRIKSTFVTDYWFALSSFVLEVGQEPSVEHFGPNISAFTCVSSGNIKLNNHPPYFVLVIKKRKILKSKAPYYELDWSKIRARALPVPFNPIALYFIFSVVDPSGHELWIPTIINWKLMISSY